MSATEPTTPAGPLAGLRIVEIAGLGPGPFAAMMLADMGADVVRVERTEPADFGVQRDPRFDVPRRSRTVVAADLKSAEGRDLVLALIARADGLIEGFRPGVMERLGLGPEACEAVNPRLVYGRMTGYGQQGPMAQAAGHDINYVALSGTLSLIGEAGRGPVPPGNLLGDYGGGGMYLAFGMVCALLKARGSGRGQVVDAAIVDGVASLTGYMHGLLAGGYWRAERGTNVVDGGAPYYRVYRTADDRYVSVGAIERRFYRALLDTLGLHDEEVEAQNDRSRWPALTRRIAAIFATRSRQEWVRGFEGVDACFAPVLDLAEAGSEPHLVARRSFVEVDGVLHPSPAPRFSRTSTATPRASPASPLAAETVLARWAALP